MIYQEAVEWLMGQRSMTNIIPQEPFETWQVRIAEADAAMTKQAYWIARAHEENIITEAAERDAAQEREVAYRNALMDAAKDFDQAGMGNCCQRIMDELNRIINAAEAADANN